MIKTNITIFIVISVIINVIQCVPLPIYANIVRCIDRLNNSYGLFSSTLFLNKNDVGAWLTEIETIDNNNGTWTFITNLYNNGKHGKEIMRTIHGNFSTPLENELLFDVTPGYWHEFVNLDNIIADVINSRLERFDGFGKILKNDMNSQPNLDSSIDKFTFLYLYGVTNNQVSLQSNLLLQVLVFSLYQRFDFSDPSTSTRAQDLYQEITPLFILRKTNLFNIWRQKMLSSVFF
jgi:hypothetical protein